MGGFWSNEEDQWKQEEQRRQNREAMLWLRNLEQQRRLAETRRQWNVEQQSYNLAEQQRRLDLEEIRRRRWYVEQPRQQFEEKSRFLQKLNLGKITPNLALINGLREAFSLGGPLPHFPQAPYEKIELDKFSPEYLSVATIFKRSNKPNFTITGIVKINNPFHSIQYHLMKQRRLRDEHHLQELLMFHGTKKECIDGICKYNFDRSKVKAHKFGHGTSFAKDAYYATHYHMDNKRKMAKVMVIAKVSYGSLQEGSEHMIIPEAPHYTSANDHMSVIVKYDDASSVPLYVIHYNGLHPPKTSRKVRPILFT